MFNIYFLSFLFIISACNTTRKNKTDVALEFISLHQNPIIGKNSSGAEQNLFGFEGGTAHKINGEYYIFSTEIFDKPKTAAVRLSQWKSLDGINFIKLQDLAVTNYNWDDTTYNMSPWSPMCIYDTKEERWNVFYVGYKRKPNSSDVSNMSGRIRRLVASEKGKSGIASKYINQGLINMPGPADKWEGPAETVSFYPYQVGNKWYAFYGSNTAPEFIDPSSKPQLNNKTKILFWLGLSKSSNDSLNGKWQRLSETNPVLMDSEFMENPVVTKINDSLYIALYDGGNKHEISYAISKDGINWGNEKLVILKDLPKWLNSTRTPLCLIDEGNDIYTIYFTAFDGINADKVPPLWHDGFGNIGMIKVKLVYQ